MVIDVFGLVRIAFLTGIITIALIGNISYSGFKVPHVATSKAQAGKAVIGGHRMSCSVAEVIVSNKSPVLAYATAGKIVFNRQKMQRYPSITQRIIFLHECAHQYVGLDETQADCWAVRAGKRRGWLTPNGLNTVCRSFYNNPGSSVHLPGPARCEAMKVCYNNTKSPSRSAKRRR